MKIGFFHIPKSAGMYLTQRLNLALDLPDITVHKVLDFQDISVKSLGDIQNEIGDQYLILGQSGYSDQVITSYPYYGGHLSKFDLIRLNRNFRFTSFSDPWKRAFSLFNYSLNHSLTPTGNVEEQFENWLINDFSASILRQFYGEKLGESHDFSFTNFNQEFVDFFNEIYMCEPDEVISNLRSREDLGLTALTSGPKVNTASGVNYFKFFKNPANHFYNIFSESLHSEIELIEYAKGFSKLGEKDIKTRYSASEFEHLYDTYCSK